MMEFKHAGNGSKAQLIEALDQVTTAAERRNEEFVTIVSGSTSYSLFPTTVRDAINALKLTSAPKPPAEPSADQLFAAFESLPADEAVRVIRSMTPPEPSVEQCIDAMNRAKHRGACDWDVCANGKATYSINREEILGIGMYYLSRERSEAAKGGA